MIDSSAGPFRVAKRGAPAGAAGDAAVEAYCLEAPKRYAGERKPPGHDPTSLPFDQPIGRPLCATDYENAFW